jgi:heme/copper-type cytochrome/quinol oxidase subunit 2
MPDKKPLIIAVVGVVVVIIVAVVAVSLKKGAGPSTGGVKGVVGKGGVVVKGEDAFRPENAKALGTVEGGTREVVQERIATPGENAAAVPANVAVPTTVVETGPSAFRHFDISATGNAYSPSTIVVNEGDVIDLSFTATDRDYDIFFPDFGVYKAAKKGQTVKLQFQGYPFGQYAFRCSESCGSAKVEGKLIVNKK